MCITFFKNQKLFIREGAGMKLLENIFKVNVSQDKMLAEIDVSEQEEDFTTLQMTKSDVIAFLQKNNVTNGILEETIFSIVNDTSKVTYPITIAKGKKPVHGKDGQLQYIYDFNPHNAWEKKQDFRDIMQIPSVKKGEKIATLIAPTDGEAGFDVSGATIPSYPGKKVVVKAGKNVVYREADQCFYATTDGQLSWRGKYIQVQPVYEVNQTLSMKTGNIDFIGTIIIRGDVPAGYTVTAKGDVKIFGMVEAATVLAGGSIYVAEGVAGQGAGTIQADENIHVGYVNQGNIIAGKDLFVENSIFHSQCKVRERVICHRGNIIGGTLSVGKRIEAKDVGNRVGVKTEVMFGLDQKTEKEKRDLLDEKQKLEVTLSKLALLEKKLNGQQIENDSKLKITLLRYKHSLQKTKERLAEVNRLLNQLETNLGDEEDATLVVRNYLHANVVVAFGKYYRISNGNYQGVKVQLVDNEIVTSPLT
ncbi:hypothetical protein CAI16_01125 [Virgibacillus dokdonensis]|uniref:Flagellar Assembly Protein A N-terminal region domain-containing protein n=2 Tax=Virgibacillus dokdonensis TaxID=302167 RepID=A0A3E0WZZ5_9BACI|nr:hypothetical protein CAI16_01125 [Virgibacillus dokdonensis]